MEVWVWLPTKKKNPVQSKNRARPMAAWLKIVAAMFYPVSCLKNEACMYALKETQITKSMYGFEIELKIFLFLFEKVQ